MLSINISELVLTIISFFLLLFLLNKFLYKPVLKFMQERQARVDAALEKQRAAEAEVAELQARIEGDKDARRDEAKAILAAQRETDGKAKDELTRALAGESADARRDARAQVEAEAKAAAAALAGEKTALAQALAERLIGK